MAKAPVIDENVPIDKVESFLQANFKMILIVLGAIIVLSLAVYMYQKNLKLKHLSKLNSIGQYEMFLVTNLANEQQISEYLRAVEELPDVKDYAYYNIGTFYMRKGDFDKAMEYFKKSGGNFAELSSSGLYDSGGNIDLSSYSSDGYLKPIWQYRKILSMSDKNQQLNAIKDFEKSNPKSNLTVLLKNWENL
jgi:tetratricopeptide (TPR) repeat protein